MEFLIGLIFVVVLLAFCAALVGAAFIGNRKNTTNINLNFDKAILSLDEAEAYSGIDAKKLRNICMSEDTPSFVIRDGKEIKIKKKDFDNWLSNVSNI